MFLDYAKTNKTVGIRGNRFSDSYIAGNWLFGLHFTRLFISELKA